MQVYNLKTDAEKLQNATINTKTAVALGQFDSMHIGHTEIIANVVKYAKENGLKSLVHIFENNPLEVVKGEKIQSVNSLEKRLEILKDLDVDIVCITQFDADYMNIEYKDFVSIYLRDMFNAALVSVGYNYRFGKGGIGDAALLTEECSKYNICVTVMPGVKRDGEVVSSTRVKEKLAEGDAEGAKKMLGRYFSVKGEVVRGNQIGGKLLGFPTANIELPQGMALPKFGVYATRTRVRDKIYKSVTNIGSKPTVENGSFCIETHIDGVFDQLYGEIVEIEFCKFMRDIKKFDSLDKLREQLKKDKQYMV